MKKIYVCLGLILVLACLSFTAQVASASPAAWPMVHNNAQNSGMSSYPGPKSSEIEWSFPISYSTGAVVDNSGTIYVLDNPDGDYFLYAISKDGNMLWSYPFTGAWWGLDRAPALGPDGTVYIGTYEYTTPIGGALIAFTKDGQIKWQYRTDGGLVGSPIVDSNGIIYVGSTAGNQGERGYLYAIYPNGALKWRTPFRWRISSTPAIGNDGTVYVAADGIYAVKMIDGSIKWISPAGGSSESLGPSIGPDGTIYYSSGSNLLAINPNDGSRKWSFETGQGLFSVPAISNSGKVFVSSTEGNLYAVRVADGYLSWSFNLGDSIGDVRSTAIDVNGNVYIAGKSSVYALTQDGTVLWSAAGMGCSVPIISIDSSLFCASSNRAPSALYKFAPSLLILQLPLEDGGTTTADTSGNGNDGKVNNAVFLPGGGAFNSNAYQFTWSSQSNIQVPYKQSQTATEALTLEAWIYPTAWDNITAGYNRIVSKYPCYLLRGVNGRAHFNILTQNHGYKDVIASDVMAINQWHYVVGTFDGQIMKLYVDGVLQGSTDLGVKDTIVTNNGDIYIGENPRLNEGFTGIIDNVAIYKKAKPQSEIERTYTENHYTISVTNTAANGAGGTITSSDGGISCGTSMSCQKDYNKGALVTLTAVPDPSSIFTGWSGGGCGSSGDCVVFMDRDTVIAGSFVKKNHTITATAGIHGSITPSGAVTAEQGSNLLFNIIPDQNYHISNVLVDGASAGPLGAYTFTNISSDHTITASFDQYEISGYVRTADRQGIQGVVMGGLPGNPTTDANGYYIAKIGPAKAWTITPAKAAYVFSPVSLTANVPPNRTSVDFTGIPIFSISGRMTDINGLPLAGVTVSTSTGNSTTTDGNGNYTLGGLQKATYVLTPNKSGYAFSPISRTLSLSSNLTNMNFQAAAIYSVKGRIIDEYGNPISGAMVLTDTGQSVLTDSNGYFTIAVMAGNRTFTISKGGYTFAAPTALNVSTNINNLNFKGYNKPPIVMVHGWRSNAEETFKENFNNIPGALEEAGYHIEFANLQTTWKYTPSVLDNVKGLMEAIKRARDATGQPKVILIAHSMGGLVSRAYIEGTRYQDDVSVLYTFGTPHLGTPMALFRFLGVPLLLDGGPAVEEMSPENMILFNLFFQRRPGVEYHLIGGDAPMDVVVRQEQCWNVDIDLGWFGHLRWRWCIPEIRMPAWTQPPYLRNEWGWLAGLNIPGQDDAFVSTDSATGIAQLPLLPFNLSGNLDRASTDEVHGTWAGVYSYFSDQDQRSRQPPSRSYHQCLKKVLVNKTTNTCGRWSTGSRVPTTAAAAVGLKAFGASVKSSSQSMEESPPSLEQHTPIAMGTLLAEKKEKHTIRIEGGVTAFAAHWTSGSVAVTLIDPNGQTIDPAFADSHPDVVQYGADNNTAIYYFRNATAGKWQLLVKGGSDIAAEGSNYSAFAALQSTLTISSQMDKGWYAPGNTAHISALFSEVPSSANVTATFLYSDGSSNVVTLSPNGQGQYEASVAVTDIPGYTQVRLETDGIKADGSPFERGQELLFQISPHSAVLNGTYSDHPDPRPEDSSLYQALNVTVGINSAINGRIGLSADLVDANGDFVAHSMAIEEIIIGASTLVLRFSGADIFAAQRNGPYHLTNLLLTDNREATLVVTEARDAYTTGIYDYRTFAERHNFPTASAGGPYSVNEGDSITLTALGNDPENDPLTFAWDLNDDGIFETPGQSVTFSAEGINGPHFYIIRVQVINSKGFSVIDQTTLDVVNVAPVVQAGSDATIQPGERLSRSGSFTDSDTDTWTATVDYGDGTGVQPLTLTGTNFELNHLYSDIGVYPVTVTVSDNDDSKGTGIFKVTVSKIPDDLDGDGITDNLDACPYSNLSATVVLGSCDTGVRNPVDTNGCTIFDRIAKCGVGINKPSQFVSCVSQLTNNLKQAGIINDNEEGAIQRCAAQANNIILSDIDGNGTVDCNDLAIVKASFGKRTGQAGFDARADVNKDGVVDVRDLSFVSRQLPAGTKCP